MMVRNMVLSPRTGHVRRALAGALCGAALVVLAAPASAQVVIVNTTDRGGTVTAGGVAQNAIAANASRKGWCLANPLSATDEGIMTAEKFMVRLGGTASATAGIEVQPGSMVCNFPGNVDQSAVSIFGASTAHRWYAWETQ